MFQNPKHDFSEPSTIFLMFENPKTLKWTFVLREKMKGERVKRSERKLEV